MIVHGLSAAEISDIVKSIRLHLPKSKIYAFGSRVSGTHRKYSDLDLALDNGSPIEFELLEKIKERLSESNLPIIIDIVDYRSATRDFRSIVDRQKVELK